MADWLARLVTVRSADADTQRRGRLLVIVTIGVMMLSLAFMVVVVAIYPRMSSLATLLVAQLIFVAALLLGRAGYVDVGAYLLIGTTVLAIGISIPRGTSSANTPFFLTLPVMLAAVLLRPIQIWPILVLTILGFALGVAALPADLRDSLAWEQARISVPLLLLMLTLLAYLSARSGARALEETRQARAEAEAARQDLLVANAGLEERVHARTAEMMQALADQRAISAELERSLQAQNDLNRLIDDLAVPVIPIRADALIVPLVGNIGSDRAEQVLASTLERIEGSAVRYVILDVTGVAIVDTQVAAALIRVATATRLMGAETLLVGIRPEVAQALVHLGVDLRSLRTAASLQDSLQLL